MALPQLHRNRITALVAVTVFGFAGTLTAAVTAEAVGRSTAASAPAEDGPREGRTDGGHAGSVVVVRNGTAPAPVFPDR
ncbi:hypothetical protein [Streptomyces sp. I05A-00742]|uniref:hypothetical protein n=1 Tax=Streptomyces sp. I05A-00742 TaxID=2732853 RepID=UPI0014883215|nr:hypothetical protein [Streptomyces sp. I05A-00742]